MTVKLFTMNHFTNLLRAPKTTVAGLLAILGAVSTIVHAATLSWWYLVDVDVMSPAVIGIVTGLGLLAAADQSGHNIEQINANTTQIAANSPLPAVEVSVIAPPKPKDLDA